MVANLYSVFIGGCETIVNRHFIFRPIVHLTEPHVFKCLVALLSSFRTRHILFYCIDYEPRTVSVSLYMCVCDFVYLCLSVFLHPLNLSLSHILFSLPLILILSHTRLPSFFVCVLLPPPPPPTPRPIHAHLPIQAHTSNCTTKPWQPPCFCKSASKPVSTSVHVSVFVTLLTMR